jgi:hypothetical protein
MRKVASIGLSLLFGLTTSCVNDRIITSYLDMAEAVMHAQPDSALKILQAIDAQQIPHESLQARYALLYTQALDKNYLAIPNDNLIDLAVNYYSRKKDYRRLGWAFLYQGNAYGQRDSTGLAMGAYLKAQEQLKRFNDDYLLGVLTNEMASLYQEQSDYEKALHFFKQSLSAFRRIENRKNEGAVLEQIAGLLYISRHPTDSIQYYYDEARAIATERNDLESLYRLLASNAIVLHVRKEYTQAKELLSNTIQKYKQGIIPLECYPLLCYLHFDTGQLDSARHYMLSFISNSTLTPKRRAGALNTLRSIEESAGNFQQALLYSSQHTALTDSITRQRHVEDLRLIEAKHKHDTLTQEKSLLLLKSILFAFLAIIVTITCSFMYVKWRKRRNELQYKPMKEFIKNAYLNNWHPELFAQHFMQKPAHCADANFYSIVTQLAKDYFPGLIDLLKTHYPTLNEVEITLICLLYAGIEKKYLCSVYNVPSANAMYTRCYRLYQKLGIKTAPKDPGSFRDRLFECLSKDLV